MEINTMSIRVSWLTTQTRSSVNEKELDWLTLSCLSCWIAVDAFAILTVCTTKLQMHPIQHNTLKSNFVSFTGTSVEKLSILLPLIFHPSSGLSVVLGTRRKAGSWGWSGVRKTVKRLLNYRFLSAESAQWENCPRGEERSRRSSRFMARMICFAVYNSSCFHGIHLRKTKPSSMYKVIGWERQSCFTISHVFSTLCVFFCPCVQIACFFWSD